MSDTDSTARDTGPVSMNGWARVQRKLLRLERDEEVEQVAGMINQLTAQECMERGVSLVPLAVTGLSTGLYGRACVSVGDPKGRPLPAHRLGAGDQVRLYSSKGGKGDVEGGISEISGVVGKVTEGTVEVISEDADDAGSLRAPLRLDVVASEATHKKLMLGLDALEKYPGGGPAERVINVLFGLEPPSAAAVRSTPAAKGTTTPAAVAPTGPPAATISSPALRSLNESQREAVAFALATRDVALIHGPPGTGKTTTVVALIREAVARGWRCLVCAPSNVAVDGILEKLVAVEEGGGGGSAGGGGGGGGGYGGKKLGGRPRVVRMGHPARLLPQVLEHSMEALVSRHEGTAIVKDVRKDIDTLLGRLYGEPGAGGGGGGGAGGVGKSRSRIRGADRKGARMELKTLRKEARTREGKVVQEVLRSRDVVLATCVGAATHSLREEEFDLVVIDEAAQALEAACWIPILKGRRLVLAGDHKQLAPTVKSRKAEAGCLLPSEAVSVPPPQAPPRSPGAHGGNSKDGGGGGGGGVGTGGEGGVDGLGLTMFDRVLRDLGHSVCRMLNVQYRMNRDICDWASGEMYGGLLLAHPSVAERELPDLPHASSSSAAMSTKEEEEGVEMWAAVMLLVDTTGCDMPEEDAGGGSRRNEREAEVAVRHVKGLLNAGVRESEVAVISPYNGQVNLLKRLLRPEHPGVEVRSVDGFQGGEKEAIVLSLVRSNAGKKVGFLADARRLNVAVTRAKRHVAIVCDAECCGSNPFIGRLLRHVEDRGEYRSALELTPETDGDFAESAAAAAAVAAVGRTAAGGVAGRKGKKYGEEGEEEKLSDEEVLRRVQEFAEQEPTHDSDEEEKGDGDGRLELPPELTARQRALAHETAEWLGLGHVSVGEGPRRVLVLSRLGGADASGPGARGLEPSGIVDGGGGGGSSSTNDAVVAGEANDGGSIFTVLAAGVGSEHDTDTDEGADSGGGGGGGGGGSGDDDDDDGSPQRQQGAQAPPTEAPAAVGGGGAVLQGEGGAAAKGAGKSAAVGRRSAATTPSPSAAVGPGAAVARSSGAGGLTGTNALLANLHAERSARRPPAPPPGNRTTGGKGKAAAAAADGGVADDRGFTVDLPNGGGGGGKKGSSKKGGSGSKKGKRKPAGGKAGAGAKSAAGGGGTITKKDTGRDDGGDGDDDDDLAFLDAQIRKERRAEPCYASLLRSTTDAMRQNNPRWAAAQDRGKPAKSAITGARRAQLKGALQTRLTEEEKKRGKSSADKGEKKS